MVECQLPKLDVASSNLVSRSTFKGFCMRISPLFIGQTNRFRIFAVGRGCARIERRGRWRIGLVTYELLAFERIFPRQRIKGFGGLRRSFDLGR